MAIEDGRVDVDGEAARFRSLDRRNRAVEHALLRNRLVVVLLQAVKMHREKQIGRGLEQIELLLQKQRVGAERDEFLARHETAHDLADLLVDQRFAAGDRHHRRAAFIGSVPALLRRHAPIEDRIGIVDLATADAGEVTAEQRFQHQHQGIALPAKQLLLDHIAADTQFLEEGYCHSKFLSGLEDTEKWISPQSVRPEAGIPMFSSRPGSTETVTGPLRRKASITSST